MPGQKRPPRTKRKTNPPKVPQLHLDPLEIQDFRHLFAQALGVRKALSLTPQQRQNSDSHDERQLEAILAHGIRLPKTSLETSAVDKAANTLATLDQGAYWQLYLCQIPPRLGHETKVDLTAQAVTAAYQYKVGRTPALAHQAYRRYEQAISAVRDSIDTTDASLIAVALLSLFEMLIQATSPAQIKHREGIGVLLLARRQSDNTPTDFERAVLFSDWNLRNRAPVAKGVASPFEDPYWLEMQPPETPNSPPALPRLQKVTNQLLIRMPALIAKMRALRRLPTDSESCPLVEMSVALANELLNLDDPIAHSEILHRVSVTPTADDLDRTIAPYSFGYPTLREMECCLTFWRMRVDILRICLALYSFPRSSEQAAAKFPLSQSAMKSKLEDLISNIVMSRQHAMKIKIYGPLRLIEVLFSAWAAASSLESWRDKDTGFLRFWIMKRFDECSHRPNRVTTAILDDEAGIIVGGPLRGFWVDTLASRPQKIDSIRSRLSPA